MSNKQLLKELLAKRKTWATVAKTYKSDDVAMYNLYRGKVQAVDNIIDMIGGL